MKTVVLGITASIAAFKSLELTRELVKRDIKVIPVLTPEAKFFVTPLSLESLSSHKTFCDFFAESEAILHIAIMNEADCIAIVPATANFIGKLAHGAIDNLLLGITFASDKPVLIAPAMNTRMWNNPILQENVKKLKDLGYHFSGPVSGALACKEEGVGRLENLEIILEDILALLDKNTKLKGKRVLVTLGRTKEYLDPIRFLSNDSSGRFGLEISKAAQRSGAAVTIVAGETDVSIPATFRVIRVTNTEEMKTETLKLLPKMDIIIMNAACSDFTPKRKEAQKIKKHTEDITVSLKRTPDILSHIKSKKTKQLVVGFSLDTKDAEASARKKMSQKGTDIMVANTAASIGGDKVEMLILTHKKAPLKHKKMSKREAADRIIELIASHFS